MIRTAFAWILLLPALAHAETLNWSVPPEATEKYQSADFRLWVPDGVKQFRAIIIRQHGCGRRGLEHADDVQWQALARRFDAALLGTHFQPTKECADWFDPAKGSDRALAMALKHFADQTQHAELTSIPWAIWGHSGGSIWAMNMTNLHPERVIAVFARSGAVVENKPEAFRVPMILNYGEREKTGRFVSAHTRSLEALTKGRAQAALWSISVDPKAEHDTRNSRELAIPFFAAMLEARLPENGNVLKTIDPKSGWLGDLESLRVGPFAKFEGDPAKMVWLPNEKVAMAWREFAQTGTVVDQSAPIAPTRVMTKDSADGMVVTWDAIADLESGIAEFRIYRDGAMIGKLTGEKTKGNPTGKYQVWNYGDEADPAPAPLRFIDKEQHKEARYQVSTVNRAGLESKKSP